MPVDLVADGRYIDINSARTIYCPPSHSLSTEAISTIIEREWWRSVNGKTSKSPKILHEYIIVCPDPGE
jgi:hypothetical protein